MRKPPQPKKGRSLLEGVEVPKGMGPKNPDLRGRVQRIGEKTEGKKKK